MKRLLLISLLAACSRDGLTPVSPVASDESAAAVVSLAAPAAVPYEHTLVLLQPRVGKDGKVPGFASLVGGLNPMPNAYCSWWYWDIQVSTFAGFSFDYWRIDYGNGVVVRIYAPTVRVYPDCSVATTTARPSFQRIGQQ